MPVAEQIIELDGSLALETNVSQHSGDPQSFRVFKDLVTDVGRRIVKRDGKGATLGSVAGTEIQALHEYIYTNPSTGAESYHTLGAIDGGSYIYRWDGATTWVGQTLPITPTAGGRWFFWNADNRVFLCNGKDALLIGVQTAPSTLTWHIAGCDAPSFAPTYSLTSSNGPYSVGTVTVSALNLSTVTGTIPAIWPNAAVPTGFAGAKIIINGNRYDVSTVAVVGNGTTVAPVLTLTQDFNEVPAGGLPYTIYWGVADWADNPPQYRFSYYNPTSGHASNPSPVLQISEQNQEKRTPVITIPGSAENTAAYNNGYTQIQLFRTALDSGVLVALNEKLTNNNAGSAITYNETAAKFLDTYLTDIEAPTKNRKPPAGLSCGVFHQGRNFAYHPASGKLYFTPISVELDFGVYSESWPALYSRTIPGGRGILVVGGESSADSLVIQTSRGDYSLDGFDSTTFAPYRLQTRRSGGYLGAATDVDGSLVQFYADKRFLSMGTDLAQKIQDKLNDVKDSLISKVRLHWFAAKARNFLFLSVPKGSSSTVNDYTYVFDLDRDNAIYEWNFGLSAFATVHDANLALQLFAGDAAGAVWNLLTGATQDAAANFAPTFRTSLLRFPERMTRIKYVKLFVNDPQLTGAAGQEQSTLWTGALYINEQTSSGATDGTYLAMTFRQERYTKQSAQGHELIWTPAPVATRSKAKVFQIDVTFPNVNAALQVEKIIIGFDAEQAIGKGTGKQS